MPQVLTNMSSDSFSALPLLPFLRSIASGDEQPFVKSEPAPDEQPAPGKVATVVGSTFGALVDDESLDVLLVLYTSKPPGTSAGPRTLLARAASAHSTSVRVSA